MTKMTLTKLLFLLLSLSILSACKNEKNQEEKTFKEVKNTEVKPPAKADTSKEEWLKEMKSSGLYKHAWGLN